jgi:deoxyribose-phosphate aldolase
MDKERIIKACDHTLLKPETTWHEIVELCNEGMKYGVASVCIPPCFVHRAKEYVSEMCGSDMKICTVVGFPNGNTTMQNKVAETEDLVRKGADEIDMVINIGELKEDSFHAIEEIKQVKKACGERILKVIVEACLLTEDEKKRAVRYVSEGGADYIKTSTGFSSGGATIDDVRLFKEEISRLPDERKIRIKAAGGISGLEDAEKFLDIGADRLGTSKIVKLLERS